MAQADLGKVKLTDAELLEKIILANGGVKFGKDADGKPGYVVVDAETGADTVIPFSSGEGDQELPVKGSICFAGSNVNAVKSAVTYSIYDMFDEPIEISKITNIEVTINIKAWKKLENGSSCVLKRSMFLELYVMNGNVVSRKTHETLFSYEGSEDIEKTNQKVTIMPSSLSEYEKLAGIGCRFAIIMSGTTSSYWFITKIGDYTKPNESKMDYIIS